MGLGRLQICFKQDFKVFHMGQVDGVILTIKLDSSDIT